MIIVLAVVGIIFEISSVKEKSELNGNRNPVLVTEENLPAYLSSFEIVHDLPKSANIQITFGKKDYVITKGEVRNGLADESDISLWFPEEYIGKLGYGICNTLREAVKNGDLKMETSLSNTELLWRYKGMLKYRDCIRL